VFRALASLVLFAAPAPLLAVDPPKDGAELIGLMRERYAGKWYHTLTFVQKTTLGDGKVETWYEAAELPGKLRIDIAPLEGKNTLLFRNDSIYDFKNGKLVKADPMIHPLMVLASTSTPSRWRRRSGSSRPWGSISPGCTSPPGRGARPTWSAPSRATP
jgi:hypothetical protein